MLILLITHIIIAVSGITVAAASVFTLSPNHIKASYVLTAGTIATGTGLVFTGGDMLRGCLSGLLYITAAVSLTQFAKHRLAKQKI